MTNKKKIIVVEDDSALQDVIGMMLINFGYEVTVYGNGLPIMDNSFSVPDLFILDKRLPHIDGLDICRHLKKQEQTSQVPVVVLSASPNVEQQAIDAGANVFLEKPFNLIDLIKTVKSLIV